MLASSHKEKLLSSRACRALFSLGLSFTASLASGQKTYKHASTFQVAILDETIRLHTGNDLTVSHTSTDAKLDGGGQGVHFLHTEAGDFRVEAPVNSGATILAALAAPKNQTGPTVHNKWFLDKTAANTQVLFASKCHEPNKKHPNDVVRCVFWFPDPDSDSHEYMTTGDFTPYLIGSGTNTSKVANALCGTGKLNADTESKLCGPPPMPIIPAQVVPPSVSPVQSPSK